MGVEYLVAGALITCPLGTTQEQVLLIPDDHGTYVDGKLVAREIDCEPIKNIAPFGICTFTQKPCFPDFAGKQWINTHADSCLTGGKEAATTESRLYCLTGKKLLIPTDSGQGPICPEEASDFELWLLDAKEYLAQIFYSQGLRLEKAFDSLPDFIDFLSYGMIEGYRSRYNKLSTDPNIETFFNWLLSGFVDTVKGARYPEKPLSLEHWLDSLGVVTTVAGGYKLTKEFIDINGKIINGTRPESLGVGNPVRIEGRGSTGRTIPKNLNEQMAMHEVRSNPLGNSKKLPLGLGDKRWDSNDGWVKMQSIVKTSDGGKIVIHFNYNEVTGTFDDFKFKD